MLQLGPLRWAGVLGASRPDSTLGTWLITVMPRYGATNWCAAFAPDEAAIEQTFVNKDGAGTLKLGQARGVALLTAAQAGVPIGEYAPNRVKKTVVGVGHADKGQILHMVKLQLPGCQPAGPDAADALAIAICHAFYGGAAQAPLREVVR